MSRRRFTGERVGVVLGAWLAGAAVAAAQNAADTNGVARYELEECLRIGLERSAQAANARLDEMIGGEKVRQARALALPNLSLKGDYTRLDEVQSITVGDESFESGRLDNYSVSASASQLLYASGKVRAALSAAGLSKDYALWQRVEVESALARDIRTSFYDVLLARASIDVNRQSLDQLKSFLDQVTERFRNGKASEFDVITAQVRYANGKPALIRAENAYELAKERFRKLVKLGDGAFELVGELRFEPFPRTLDECLDYAMVNRAALKEMEAVVRLREQDTVAARAEGRPSLRAFANYNGANSFSFVAFEEDWQWHWNAGLVLDWNLWDGGLTRATVSEKRLEYEKSRTEQADLEDAVRLEVRQAYLDMMSAVEAVDSASGNIELATRGLQIARSRYDSGLATYLEFTESNVALSQARLTWYGALTVHLNAVARLVHACGYEFPGGDAAREAEK